MSRTTTLLAGPQPNSSTSITKALVNQVLLRYPEFTKSGQLWLVKRRLLESRNDRTRRTYAAQDEYVRPASLEEAQLQDTMVPTVGAAIFLGISLEALRKQRQRGRGPAYYRYGPDGPIVYSVSHLLAHKHHLAGVADDSACLSVPFAQIPRAITPEYTFFSCRGAALILGVSTSTLKQWRHDDVGPHYFQFGYKGRVLYKLSDLNDFKAACVVTPVKGARA